MENNEIGQMAQHPLADVGDIPENLAGVFSSSWIETVEQAVGFLCSSGIDVEGKDAFLAKSKAVLGEETYLKYSTPVEHPPFGCEMQKIVEIVADGAATDAATSGSAVAEGKGDGEHSEGRGDE